MGILPGLGPLQASCNQSLFVVGGTCSSEDLYIFTAVNRSGDPNGDVPRAARKAARRLVDEFFGARVTPQALADQFFAQRRTQRPTRPEAQRKYSRRDAEKLATNIFGERRKKEN